MLGINKGFSPRFLRRYADLHTVMTAAVEQYVRDVKECDFPNEKRAVLIRHAVKQKAAPEGGRSFFSSYMVFIAG